MRLSDNNFIKYLRLYFYFNKLGLNRLKIYKTNFILDTIIDIIGIIIAIVFYKILYLQINNIGGWKIQELYLLVISVKFVNDIYNLFFGLNINSFPNSVQTGYLDYLLTKPKNLIFLVSFLQVNLKVLSNLIVTIFLFIFVIVNYKIPLSLLNIAFYCFALIISIIVKVCFTFLISQLSFLFIKIDALFSFFNSFFSLSTFPSNIFKKKLYSFFFTYCIPVIIIGNFPVKSLLNKLHFANFIVVTGFSVILLIFSIISFKLLIKRYMSVTS